MSETKHNEELIGLLGDESYPESKRERTRLKIMASAAKVFAEKGFDETSVQDIADHAGIAKGTIYYYINKKEDLLLSLIKFAQGHLFAKIETSIGKVATASEKIEIIVHTHLKILRIFGPIVSFFAQSLFVEDSSTRLALGKFRKRYLNLLELIIDEGIRSGEFRRVDSQRAAVAILGMVIGQIMQAKLFTGKIDIRQIKETTMDMVINSLRAKRED